MLLVVDARVEVIVAIAVEVEPGTVDDLGPRIVRPGLVVLAGHEDRGAAQQVGLQLGLEVVETREPTNGSWGQRIREMARSGAVVAVSQHFLDEPEVVSLLGELLDDDSADVRMTAQRGIIASARRRPSTRAAPGI